MTEELPRTKSGRETSASASALESLQSRLGVNHGYSRYTSIASLGALIGEEVSVPCIYKDIYVLVVEVFATHHLASRHGSRIETGLSTEKIFEPSSFQV
jgi:hypothetical protein